MNGSVVACEAPSRVNAVVIVVNYKTPGDTMDAVRSAVQGTTALKVLVVVVDNGSQDGSFESISEQVENEGLSDNVWVLRSDRNRGFGGGNNYGIHACERAGVHPDFYFLLNPDAKVRGSTLDVVADIFESDPTVGVVGAQLVDEDGTKRPCAFNVHTAATEVAAGFQVRMLSKYTVRIDPTGEATQTVGWVSGAAMAVRREALERVGLFDERIFLYFEETDLCRRISAAGLRCVHAPGAEVSHLAGQSTGVTSSDAKSRPLPAYWFDARAYYLRKYNSTTKALVADAGRAVGTLAKRAWNLARGRTQAEHPHFARSLISHAIKIRIAPGEPSCPPLDPPDANAEFVQNDGSTNQNPRSLPLFSLIREDFETCEKDLSAPGFWMLAIHRLGNARMDLRPGLRPLGTLAYRTVNLAGHWVWGIKLDYVVEVGRRVRLWHHGGMVLGAVRIGDDVHIRQNTTFGLASRDGQPLKPRVQAGADIGAGAVIIGGVTVGERSVVGANSVVNRDVDPGTKVGGVPAKVLKKRSSAEADRASSENVAG